MTSPVTRAGRVLFPNFGAEENDALPQASPPLVLQHLLHQWQRALVVADGLALVSKGLVADGLVAWLNTPLAQRAADARGLRLFGADVDVVKMVHDKGFCARVVDEHGLLPDALRGRIHVVDAVDLTPANTKRFAGLVAKPRFATSGRGRVLVPTGGLSQRSCDKLKARGGAVFEPWLDRDADWSTQWWIDDDGVRWLGTTRALQHENGVWRGAALTIEDDGTITSGHALERELVELSQPVVTAAAAAGYRGACGVDLFRFALPGSPRVLRACELNARFTAGFVAVMLAHACKAGVPPGPSFDGRGARVTWWLGAEPEVAPGQGRDDDSATPSRPLGDREPTRAAGRDDDAG